MSTTQNKPDPALVLSQWMDAENQLIEIRRTADPKALTPQEMASMSGIDGMQAMMRGGFSGPAIGKTMDFSLVECDLGKAIFQGKPSLAHSNPMGAVHGGWYATILDSALGCAVHTMMKPGMGYTTAELSVNIVKAINWKVQRLRAEGVVLHCGRQLATAEAKLYGPDGTLYAHGTTTCLVFELKL